MGKVTVYNQVGQSKREVEFSGSNWGELQELLDRENVPYVNMKAVIGSSQLTLESKLANVPSEDWVLFLVPHKVKSGTESLHIDISDMLAALSNDTDDIRRDDDDDDDNWEDYDHGYDRDGGYDDHYIPKLTSSKSKDLQMNILDKQAEEIARNLSREF